MLGLTFLSLMALAAQPAAPLPRVPPPAAVPAALPSVPAAMPAEVMAAFATAEAALSQLSACTVNSGPVTPRRLAMFDRQLQALQRRATGVWGAAPLTSLAVSQGTAPACAADDSAQQLNAAEHSMTRLTAQLNAVLAPLRGGVWFGTMPLCRTQPVNAQVQIDVYTAAPSLLITLDSLAAAELAALTRRHVGDALAFHAAGRVVVEPAIREPIVGGQLQISGPAETELRAVAARLKSCSKPAV